MQISGKTRLFKKEFGERTVYSTSLSAKKKDGQYEHMYIQVQLPKDVVVENNTDIDIADGFLSFYKNKDGLNSMILVVTKINENENSEVTSLDVNDLPF